MVQLPTIGGFSPLPLAVMAPFMAYQSAELAYAFGLNYESGKRDIKKMGNKEYNALTPENKMQMQSQHHTVSLQAFINEMPRTLVIQEKILDEYLKLEKTKIDMNIELALAMIDKVFQKGNDNLNNLFGLPNTKNQGSGEASYQEWLKGSPSGAGPYSQSNNIPTGSTYTPPASTQPNAQGSTIPQIIATTTNTDFKKYNVEGATQRGLITNRKRQYDALKKKPCNFGSEKNPNRKASLKRACHKQKDIDVKAMKNLYNSTVKNYYSWLLSNISAKTLEIRKDASTRFHNRKYQPIR